MPGPIEAALARGQAALEAGDWAAARAEFSAAVESDAAPAAMLGLAEALIWLGETEASVDLHRRAYAGFRRMPEPVPAAVAAMNLYFLYRVSLGNVAASRGWLGRLESLIEGFGLDPLRGWALLIRAHDRGESGDPEAGEELARAALAHAREGGDLDLELCALGALGALLVERGRLDEGLPLLDEAMAGSLGGEGTRLDTVVFTSCTMITACSRAAQFQRAAEWIRVAGDFAQRYGSPHVHTVCRVHYGGILFSTGRWAEAESELEQALRIARTAEPVLFAEALGRLAELRLGQGRIEEAEALLAGIEDRPTSAAPLAAIALARGDPAAAAVVARRRLRAVGDLCLEAVALVELLGEAEIALGAGRPAARRARRLAELGARVGCELVTARAERTLGCAAAAAGRPAAIDHLERALEAFCRLEMPLEAGRTHLMLAEALAASRPAEAVAEAQAAFTAFDGLGAARHADAAAALLRALGVRRPRAGPGSLALLTRRELEVLELLASGMSNREMAARLFLTRKTVEHHVHNVLMKLDLRNRAEAAAYAVRHLERDSATG